MSIADQNRPIEPDAGKASAPANCSPAPSWEDFCARMKQCAPMLEPDRNAEEWKNLYGVYEIGYASALDAVMNLLAQENELS